MTDEDIPVKKIKLSEELEELSKEELISKCQAQQEKYEELLQKSKAENETLEKLKNQVSESSKNENFLLLRLAGKEQEVQELMSQLQELKSQTPSTAQLKSMLLDSSVNLLFQQMKAELTLTKSKLEQAQKDLAAWKFSPDSLTGKRLMAKCSMLLQENEDLGRVVSSGRIAKLEGDIALQKKLISEMRKSEEETEKCLAELDETIETMQGTIFSLHTELNHSKQQLNRCLQECTCQSNIMATRRNQDRQQSQSVVEVVSNHDGESRENNSEENC